MTTFSPKTRLFSSGPKSRNESQAWTCMKCRHVQNGPPAGEMFAVALVVALIIGGAATLAVSVPVGIVLIAASFSVPSGQPDMACSQCAGRFFQTSKS